MKSMYRRPKRRGPKIALIIVGALVLALVVICLVNLNTILMMFGKGNMKVKSYAAVAKAVTSSPVYTVTQKSGSNGEQTLSCVSKDKAVSMQVQQSGGTETVTGDVDRGKLPDVDPTNVSKLKKTAEDYLGPVLSDSQILALGTSMYNDVLAQSSDDLHISKTYGDTQVKVDTGDDGLIHFKIVTKSGS